YGPDQSGGHDVERIALPRADLAVFEAYTHLMATCAPDLKAFLVATPFFGGLEDASLDRLISMLVERRFHIGETVFREEEPGRSMYVVHSGDLLVCKRGESGR